MNENLKLFKELIEKYRSITMETLLEAKEAMVNEGYDENETYPFEVLSYLTGFGTIGDCTLCVVHDSSNPNPCTKCVWYPEGGIPEEFRSQMPCTHSNTYHNIDDSSDLGELLEALKERADYMEEWLKQKGLYDKEG